MGRIDRDIGSPISSKLYSRELSEHAVRSRTHRKLYSDRSLINDLDIVNELDGHSGCVNALSWSKSGNLLASGSDDQHLNIHTYQPSTSSKQFQLTATVATGHTQNIFSVKFMPHSNDRTVITAAGDHEVRIFDLEYSGTARESSAASSLAAEGRRRGRSRVYEGVKYLSDGDTDCRVYRSHGDRVKRIVTESSPHLFLTCSEDGEVRQWDLRQPSSAYPAPKGNRFGADGSVPPPLISYKRYGLDLNTISCSASQPHYIALGGAHLHAFLHDRRMTGRDLLKETGKPLPSVGQMSAQDQALMAQATQCVRKFAPQGQKKMKAVDNGHITACKISDARPDEMIVSWSGDHIYSFDLIRDSAADGGDSIKSSKSSKVKESRDRKRKRKPNSSDTSLTHDATAGAPSRPRTEDTSHESQDTALRIRYQNGQSEDIPIPSRNGHNTPLTEYQRNARRIGKTIVQIRASLFSSHRENSDPTARFTAVLGQAASIYSDMNDIMRDWGYPMEPCAEEVYAQQKARRGRETSRRFVQAAGTLARALGGKFQTTSGVSPMMANFISVETRRNDLEVAQGERFAFDFVKAILLWLDSGIGRLIDGFVRPLDMSSTAKAASRLPIPESDATTEAVDEFLIPYLLQLATDKPICNVEVNRFEVDGNRQLFSTERAAVLAFATAVRIPFQDLSAAVLLAEGAESIQAQDRQTAHRFWANKVARGVLASAADALTFVFVDRAFGGLGRPIRAISEEEARLDPISDEEEQSGLTAVEYIDANGEAVDGMTADDITSAAHEARHSEASASNGTQDYDMTDTPGESTALLERNEESQLRHATVEPSDDEENGEEPESDEEEHEDMVDDDDDDAFDEESSEYDEEDGVPSYGGLLYSSRLDRQRLRQKVESATPCSAPIRRYRGHCNVRTVKDVNYFGPNDEYVVSGSDDGNFFIWDSKTSELVNVLEGDGEVVNVVQGHPYETMMAVSGIDHTIKIFSPDARAREIARLGQDVLAHDSSTFSTIAWPLRIGGRSGRRRGNSDRHNGADNTTTASETAVPASTQEEQTEDPNESDDYVAPTGLRSRQRMDDAYRIMQQNNVEREGGNQEAVITVREPTNLPLR